MTTKELAEKLVPQVRESVEISKEKILDDMPALKRGFVRAFWNPLLAVFVPLLCRTNIEFVVVKYNEFVKPKFGPLVEAWLNSTKNSADENVRFLNDVVSVLYDDPKGFLEEVQIVARSRRGEFF